MPRNNPDTEAGPYQLTEGDFDDVADEVSRGVAAIEDTPHGQAYATGMIEAAMLVERRLTERATEVSDD